MKKLVIAALVIFTVACASVSSSDDEAVVYSNNHVTHSQKSFWDFVSMRLFGDDEWNDPAPFKDLVPSTDIDKQALNQVTQRQVTWLGHSTFLLQIDGVTILTDPIFSERASPVSFAGPKRLSKAPIAIDQLPNVDFVIISHNHYDHLDEDSIAQLGSKPHYFVPKGLKAWFVDLGIEDNKVTEMAWWQKHRFNEQTNITATPSQHWSSRGLFDRNKTHWASWLISINDFTIWFAGDTGYNDKDFKDIGKHATNINLGLIPIGAYAPRDFMQLYHVNVEEAVQIHHDIGAEHSIGMHWGTYPLTAEPLLEPMQTLEKLTNKGEDINFTSMAIGETRPVL
ncbi:MBL fold metallo-hydrolase [Thalassotalea sp. HSM 43]|uniref:MBL fold metallo-hydrolase n=1 Tax=Thalassotalea sp. HSM 43 TaxID=2552945 RepID=UPI0010805786|nr:MBL fold metallo-hydrolase [Thalassotalea sp. HSM 43]QBY05860.1 MBL fold metallo-hydrolase [Thalassotalea sp. HSM 43]